MKVVGSLLFILLFGTCSFAQYNIKGKITGLSKSEVYLAHYFGYNQQVIKDTVMANEAGEFQFKGNELLPKGLYLISFLKSKYMSQLKSTTRSNDVTVMVYSEFGRRVKGNASQGTDHGTAGPMFILGEKINGGFYGDQPSLSKLIDGDLAVTTDFRDVYATVLDSILKSPAEQVLGKWAGRTGFMKPA